jgi:transcriptional regulator with XRE-family HTH domain
MTIAKNIKHQRELKNWSQQELAKQSGVSQSMISHIERGDKPNPGVVTVQKIADALDVSIMDLIK